MSASYLPHNIGAFLAVALDRSAESFDWASAPLSHPAVPLASASAYLVVVLLLDRLVVARGGDSNAARLRRVQAAHNLVLCVSSLVMFCGCLGALVRRGFASRTAGWMWIICEDAATESKGRLFFWSYVYYCSKFYELLDTVLQMSKGRRPPSYFLHVFHHSVVLYMSWGWLEYGMSLQFPGLLFNTLVHVVMYFYFTLKSLGYDPWWKAWVTRLQIVQFTTSAVLFGFFVSRVLAGENCKGRNFVYFNLAFNMILLAQFSSLLFKGQRNRAVPDGDGAGDKAKTS